jgi:hypothetical protein
MTMAITTSPFVLKETSLTLRPKDSTGAAQEYICQLSQAQLTPSAATGGAGGDLTTFCDTYSSAAAAGNSTWVLDLAGFQAVEDSMDLTIFLFEHEGETYEFQLTPKGPLPVSATNPAFRGEVTLQPTQIGGTAAQFATFTVSLPVSGKPRLLKAPEALMAEYAEA